MTYGQTARWLLPMFLSGLVPPGESGLQAQAREDWLPIPAEDLVLEGNPSDPGSRAMILLKEEARDDSKGILDRYFRIKVLTDEGREYGNLEIPYVRRVQEVQGFQARVTQPDGRHLEFRGPIFEKTLVRMRKVRMQAKTLSLPEVLAGTIIEYRYQLKTRGSDPHPDTWLLQEPLFVREVRFRWKPSKDSPGRMVIRGLPPESRQTGRSAETVTLHDLPAFEREPHMPPDQAVQVRLEFSTTTTSETLTQERGFATYIEAFIGKPDKWKSALKSLVSPEDSTESQLRSIYTAVQGIRNLSYEESFTKKERKREKLKQRKSARDVWKLGYGTAVEIAMVFVALCRAAGLNADLALVVPRDERFYDPALPLLQQVAGEIAVVEVAYQQSYYDPGTRFAPFGQLSWEKEATHAALVREHSVYKISTSLARAEKNAAYRTARIELDADGHARVHFTTRFTGQEAITWKNKSFTLSSRQTEKELRDWLEGRFPAAEIQEIGFQGLTATAGDTREDVSFSFTFELPHYAQILGSRLLVKPVLTSYQSPFPHWERQHDIHFSYRYARFDEVTIIPPPGYELAAFPGNYYRQPPFAEYLLELTREQNKVVCKRTVSLNGIGFKRTQHLMLKRFFDEVQAVDQMRLVFHKP